MPFSVMRIGTPCGHLGRVAHGHRERVGPEGGADERVVGKLRVRDEPVRVDLLAGVRLDSGPVVAAAAFPEDVLLAVADLEELLLAAGRRGERSRGDGPAHLRVGVPADDVAGGVVDLDERAADRRVGVGEEVVAGRLLALFVAVVLGLDGGALPLAAGLLHPLHRRHDRRLHVGLVHRGDPLDAVEDGARLLHVPREQLLRLRRPTIRRLRRTTAAW